MRESGKIVFQEKELNKLQAYEILIRTKACGICKADIDAFKGEVKGNYLDNPGHEIVGIVEDAGGEVKESKPGDKVVAVGSGGFSDYFKVNENMVAKIPDEVKEWEYWVAEPIACVVNGIRSMQIQPGDTVILIGCGYMGLLLAQGLPKEYIAHFLTIDIDEKRLKLAQEFGADTTLNPSRTDVAKYIEEKVGKVDVVIEATGVEGILNMATGLVRRGGKLVIFGTHMKGEIMDVNQWHIKGLWVINTIPGLSVNFSKDLADAVKLMIKGTFNQKKLITHKFKFQDAGQAFDSILEDVSYIKGVILF